jgi:hypothetical protein
MSQNLEKLKTWQSCEKLLKDSTVAVESSKILEELKTFLLDYFWYYIRTNPRIKLDDRNTMIFSDNLEINLAFHDTSFYHKGKIIEVCELIIQCTIPYCNRLLFEFITNDKSFTHSIFDQKRKNNQKYIYYLHLSYYPYLKYREAKDSELYQHYAKLVKEEIPNLRDNILGDFEIICEILNQFLKETK